MTGWISIEPIRIDSDYANKGYSFQEDLGDDAGRLSRVGHGLLDAVEALIGGQVLAADHRAELWPVLPRLEHGQLDPAAVGGAVRADRRIRRRSSSRLVARGGPPAMSARLTENCVAQAPAPSKETSTTAGSPVTKPLPRT